jgi:hypothetical protein
VIQSELECVQPNDETGNRIISGKTSFGRLKFLFLAGTILTYGHKRILPEKLDVLNSNWNIDYPGCGFL